MGFKNRLVSSFFTVPAIIFLFFKISFLAFFPKVVVAGLLAYLGISLLFDNLYKEWFRVSKLEYILVLMITFTIGTGNLVEGVVIGFVRSSIIFAIQASRISPIYQFTTLDIEDNNNSGELNQLTDRADSIGRVYVFQLEGLIFFGNLTKLFKQLDQCIQVDKESGIQRCLILDFNRVRFLDSSLTEKLAKFKKNAQKENVYLMFTDLSKKHEKQLYRGGVLEKDELSPLVFAEIDSGLQWFQENLSEKS